MGTRSAVTESDRPVIRFVDAHTHVQPSSAATIQFFERIGMPRPHREGTVAELIDLMDACGIDRITIVPWLPAQDLVVAAVDQGADREDAEQQVINEWRELNGWATAMVREHPGRLTCLVGIDPVLMSREVVAEEVRRRIGEGATGLKISPMFFDARPDDDVVEIVWQLADELGVYVLSACGGSHVGHHEPAAKPEYFDAVLRSYPNVRVQLAQLGQIASADVAVLTAKYANVVTDTAMQLGPDTSPSAMAELIRRIGVDRVLFGTNYPLVDPRDYVEVLSALPLSNDELQQVAHRNADILHASSS
ncbi:MAG: hypothetical protein JWN62_4636 [Acidimicrobiales bacterium]|nr:hypothetical protein [Acidimicrobiales bacterium]